MPHNLSAHANVPIPKPSLIPEKKHIIRFHALLLGKFAARYICSSIGFPSCCYEICFCRRDQYQKICNRKLKPTGGALHALPDSPGPSHFSPDQPPHLPVYSVDDPPAVDTLHRDSEVCCLPNFRKRRTLAK